MTEITNQYQLCKQALRKSRIEMVAFFFVSLRLGLVLAGAPALSSTICMIDVYILFFSVQLL
jgi:hypothetical protein